MYTVHIYSKISYSHKWKIVDECCPIDFSKARRANRSQPKYRHMIRHQKSHPPRPQRNVFGIAPTKLDIRKFPCIRKLFSKFKICGHLPREDPRTIEWFDLLELLRKIWSKKWCDHLCTCTWARLNIIIIIIKFLRTFLNYFKMTYQWFSKLLLVEVG